jgi:fermentation-respiration switch protein FrsA (DUF1100 family)
MQQMGQIKYPYLPVGLLINQRFDSIDEIRNLKIPLLLIHGTWDERVPVEMGKAIYETAPEPKTLLLINGGEHDNSSLVGWMEYRDALTGFIKRNAH